MKRFFLSILLCAGIATFAHAAFFGAVTFKPHRNTGVVTPIAPFNNGGPDLPQIVGLDTVGSTLSANTGNWGGTASTKTCVWHMIGGSSLGTNCASFGPLISGQIGQRLQVDVTATNGAGAVTKTSNFVGPVVATYPSAPVVGPGPTPSSLPVYPGNYLEATPVAGGTYQHAVYPGCNPPPSGPTFLSGLHVWYFDPINGTTQDGGATGHLGSPFNDLQALFNAGEPGYTGGKLWARTIQPGDTIYLDHGNTTHPLGAIATSNTYSTSNGLSSGSTVWTWILPDPADATSPVVLGITILSGAGFIFHGFHIEQNATDTSTFAAPGTAMVTVTGSIANPTTDLVFENLKMSGRKGHSGDDILQITWPTSGGHSDGSILTASPYIDPTTNGTVEFTVNAGLHATQLFLVDGIPPFTGGTVNFPLVWSPGYYYQQKWPTFPVLAPTNTGIPNGTIIQDLNGITNPNIKGTVPTSSSLPATAVVNDAYLALDTDHLWYGTAGPVWTDEGAAYVTIGPCDPVANHSIGCPSALTNNGTANAGCDPLIIGATPPGGCGGGTWPVWNGTTRAISGEVLDFTSNMTVLPAGSWNHIDANYMINGFAVIGQRVGSGNDVEGTQCISKKDNDISFAWNSIEDEVMANAINYGNRMRYHTGDLVKVYSAHRIIAANNLGTDAIFIKEHQDMIQYAQNGGTGNDFYFNNAAIDNEFYTSVDSTAPFKQSTQAIGVTDQVYSGGYFANNIIINSLNNMNTAGLYNVMVNNTVFADGTNTGETIAKSGNKSNLNVAANSMMSNNLTNSIALNGNVPGVQNGPTLWQATGSGIATACVANSPISGQHTVTSHVASAVAMPVGNTFTMQGFLAPNTGYNATYTALSGTTGTTMVGWTATGGGTCPTNNPTTTEGTVQTIPASCSFDGNTVSNNLGITNINWFTNALSQSSSTYCNPASDTMVNTTNTVVTNDFISWSNFDWRNTGSNPIVLAANPIPPPGGPGSGLGIIATNNCLQNEFPVGTCSPGAQGLMNLHLNPSFVPSNVTFTGTAAFFENLPTTGTVGDKWLVNGQGQCFSFVVPLCSGAFSGTIFPAGIYIRVNGNTDASGYGAVGTPFNPNTHPFTPGAIGTGLALGAQMPPANHARQPWTSPPNIGVY